MNRRGFLKVMLAGSASAPLITEAVSWISGAKQSLVIYDARYSDARTFAAKALRLGAAALESRQDIISLWYEGLGRYLENPEIRVMGLTAYNDFMVLRGCTTELKRQVVFEGIHDCRGGTTLTHTLRHSGAEKSYLQHTGPNWPAVLARALLYENSRYQAERETVVATTVRRAQDHPGTLVSWLIV